MQNELCSTVKKRLKPHITRAELVDLMKWKLLRGKWRPRLVQFAESNSPDLVEDVSRKAVVLAEQDEIEEAIQKLCCMKGVGPATASAILSACIPEKCAFFADEVAQVFLEGKLNYTLKEYSSFHDQIVILSDSLNKEAGFELKLFSVY
ncbi:UNVERIFIED_CONTAM: hypothetical protein GTU68_003861 [Idotea baltica]|nr:hypothetical protein [Idotea baltica]